MPVIAALAAALLASASPAASDGPRLPADVLKAFRQFDAASDELAKARSAVAAVEAGERPRGAATGWSGASASLASAADALRRSPGRDCPTPTSTPCRRGSCEAARRAQTPSPSRSGG